MTAIASALLQVAGLLLTVLGIDLWLGHAAAVIAGGIGVFAIGFALDPPKLPRRAK